MIIPCFEKSHPMYFFFTKKTQVASRFKEVWISGNSQQMADVQRMLKHAAEEADGHRVIGRYEHRGGEKRGGNQTSRGCRRWNIPSVRWKIRVYLEDHAAWS